MATGVRKDRVWDAAAGRDPELEALDIEAAIGAALARNTRLHHRITATVGPDGLVTLTGTVPTQSLRREVELSCWTVSGVRSPESARQPDRRSLTSATDVGHCGSTAAVGCRTRPRSRPCSSPPRSSSSISRKEARQALGPTWVAWTSRIPFGWLGRACASAHRRHFTIARHDSALSSVGDADFS